MQASKVCVDVLPHSKLESQPKDNAAMGQKQNPTIWQKTGWWMPTIEDELEEYCTTRGPL